MHIYIIIYCMHIYIYIIIYIYIYIYIFIRICAFHFIDFNVTPILIELKTKIFI